MTQLRFEDIALNSLIMLKDGAWGDSVAERQHGLKMLLTVLRQMPITKKHARLIDVIRGTSLWFGRACHQEAEDAIAHVKRQLPEGQRSDKKSLKKPFVIGDWQLHVGGSHSSP